MKALPKSYEKILAHADELADWFECEGPDPSKMRDATELRKISHAVMLRAAADGFVFDAVLDARKAGFNWSSIGAFLGTSGEAARQKYGKAAAMYDKEPQSPRRKPRKSA